MNKIKQNKGLLMGLGIVCLVLSIGFLIGGVALLVGGIKGISDTASAGNILKIVFGAIMALLGIPTLIFGIQATWVAGSLKATEGSIKEGNIAKEGGTVNMIKCDKCGTERKPEDTQCSECGKVFEN